MPAVYSDRKFIEITKLTKLVALVLIRWRERVFVVVQTLEYMPRHTLDGMCANVSDTHTEKIFERLSGGGGYRNKKYSMHTLLRVSEKIC